MSGAATFPWPINPVQTAQGYAVIAQIDWANPSYASGVVSFDFSSQAMTRQPMPYVGGALIDNSANDNAVFITGNGFQPKIVVLAGDVATFPIIAPTQPVLTVQQGISPTPTNEGLTIVTFTAWTQELSKTAQYVRPYTTNSGTNIANGSLIPGDGIEIYSTSQAQEFFAIQNSPAATGQLLVRIANLGTVPSTSDSLQLGPGDILTSGEFGLIPSGNLWLGCFGADVEYVVWWH
jgi:hypothetical protein